MRSSFISLTAAALLWVAAVPCANAFDVLPASDGEIGPVSWTGFIFNPDIGYETLKLGGRASRVFKDPDGFRAGAEFGYDRQLGSFVFGIAGDLFKSWIDGGRERFSPDQVGSKLDVFGSLRGRLGYAYGRALFYTTGGLAYGRLDLTDVSGGGATEAKTLTGWTAGGGIEYVYQKDITVRVQYTHLDLDTATYEALPSAFNTVHPTLDIVGVSLISRF